MDLNAIGRKYYENGYASEKAKGQCELRHMKCYAGRAGRTAASRMGSACCANFAEKGDMFGIILKARFRSRT